MKRIRCGVGACAVLGQCLALLVCLLPHNLVLSPGYAVLSSATEDSNSVHHSSAAPDPARPVGSQPVPTADDRGSAKPEAKSVAHVSSNPPAPGAPTDGSVPPNVDAPTNPSKAAAEASASGGPDKPPPSPPRLSAPTPAPVPEGAGGASQTGGAVMTDPNVARKEQATTSELVGFVVRGRGFFDRLQIDDLDSRVKPDGKRMLPLLHILRAFRVKIEEEGGRIRFTPEGAEPVELDVNQQQIRIGDRQQPIEVIQAVSETTLKPDFYVPVEDLSQILKMELVWNTDLYEYQVQLDRRLSIWNFTSGKSLWTDAKWIEDDLPESLPPAERSRSELQLLEVDWHPNYALQHSAQGGTSHLVNLSGPRETVWGAFQNGQYKAQISHPSPMWSSGEGWRWGQGESYGAQVDWFEWKQRFAASELTVGDSTSGLSDLVYPVFGATGVRINGLLGWTPVELEMDKSHLGTRQFYSRSQVFQGTAPIGATAELIVNGRTVDVQTVSAQADSPAGMGVYRFENIEIPNGILNQVTILIKEANGNEIRVDKSIKSTPQLLPQGRASYVALLGSQRERGLPGAEIVDSGSFYGYVTGGRVLYGLTDRLTVGTVLASEQGQYHRLLGGANPSPDERPFPEASQHAGATFSYLPLDNLQLSGELAASQMDQTGSQGGWGGNESKETGSQRALAARTRAEYLPTQNLTVHSDLLHLGSDYFDGSDPDVFDRQGGEVGLSWKWNKNWSLDAGVGDVRNNVDARLSETLNVIYGMTGLTTTIVPRTSLWAKVYGLDASTEERPRQLNELGFRWAPIEGLSLFGQVLLGEEPSVQGDNRFLSRLRLRDAPSSLHPSQRWGITKRLNTRSMVGLLYYSSEAQQTLSFTYDVGVNVRNHSLRLHSEVFRAMTSESGAGGYGFRTQGEYLLDHLGYNSCGVSANYQEGSYAILCYLNLRDLFSYHDRRLTSLSSSHIQPSYGCIQGKVFLDYDGDHLPDANEPGVPNVKVCLGQMTGAMTDKHGYYVLPVPPDVSQVRVYLDVATVPAVYTVTHGTQLAKVYGDSVTEVNLSLAPLISIVGHVMAVDPNAARRKTTDPNATVLSATVVDANAPQGTRTPVGSVRVSLSDRHSGLLVSDSVTGADGSYYLGDVKPGQYVLRVDPKTLPESHQMAVAEQNVDIKPTKEEFLEINLPDFVATVHKKAKPPEETKPSNAAPPGENPRSPDDKKPKVGQ